MAITDELRKALRHSLSISDYDRLLVTADRIDAEHERLMEERADEYHKLRVYVEDSCVELPKDADGETWHIGDFTESGQLVYKLCLDVHGWSFYGLVSDIDPSIHRHYHEPTVEGLLREMALACEDAGNAGPEVERIATEYAKRLQLRGDAE